MKMARKRTIQKKLSRLPKWMQNKDYPKKKKILSGRRILPKGITGKETLSTLIENVFLAYNAARLREGCRLLTEKMLNDDVTVGMSLAGALTPAGLGCSAIVPLIKAGFVDWIVSTGANMYHDLHFAFDKPLFIGTHLADDADLRENDVVRIYDIFLGHSDVLLGTDNMLREILLKEEFQKEMGTAEFHYRLGKYAAEHERKSRSRSVSVLAAAYRAQVPVYTSSPGDSTIGMELAAIELVGSKLKINPSIDVNETAAIVFDAKRSGGKSAVFLVGGGSPKNFVLQTEPQIQDVLHIPDVGHDYFLQITDARPDTGGLSGATPREAVSWGKVDPRKLPHAVVAYVDSTVALPLITAYALAKHKKRPPKRLYAKREAMMKKLMKKIRAGIR